MHSPVVVRDRSEFLPQLLFEGHDVGGELGSRIRIQEVRGGRRRRDHVAVQGEAVGCTEVSPTQETRLKRTRYLSQR